MNRRAFEALIAAITVILLAALLPAPAHAYSLRAPTVAVSSPGWTVALTLHLKDNTGASNSLYAVTSDSRVANTRGTCQVRNTGGTGLFSMPAKSDPARYSANSWLTDYAQVRCVRDGHGWGMWRTVWIGA